MGEGMKQQQPKQSYFSFVLVFVSVKFFALQEHELLHKTTGVE